MANRSVLRLQLQTVLFQMLFVLMLSGAVGFSVNMIRSNGIPVIGDWSTEGRMTAVDGMSNDTLIITYCDGENCDLSHELAIFLRDMGFPNVKVLVNGWTVWQEMNLPVEGDSFGN